MDATTRVDYKPSGDDNVILQGIQSSDTSLGWVGFDPARSAAAAAAAAGLVVEAHLVGVPAHGHVAAGVGLARQPVAGIEQLAQPGPLPPPGRVEVLGALLHQEAVGAAVAAGALPRHVAVGPDGHAQDVDLLALRELHVLIDGLEVDARHVDQSPGRAVVLKWMRGTSISAPVMPWS